MLIRTHAGHPTVRIGRIGLLAAGRRGLLLHDPHPIPMWTSLVWRRNQMNSLVDNVIDAFTADVDRSGLDEEGVWLPAVDPYRAVG